MPKGPAHNSGGLNMSFNEKDIRVVILFDRIPDKGSQVIGISNLNSLENVYKSDVIASRGEFSGYFFEDGDMVLFRDRLGARNIYYHVGENKVYVSTDLAWIVENVKAQPNWKYILSDYFQFQIPFSDDTFFSGIKKVMPGELVYINRERIKNEKYWDLKFGNDSFDPEYLLKIIKDAIEFRLSIIEASGFTSYLSGGVDSSAVTLISKPKECFSGFYEEEGYSEMNYIETVVSSNEYPENYIKVQITESEFQKHLSYLPEILPDPSCGLGIIPQVIVAREAAKYGYDYAFTGEGGDEIFLGYNWNSVIFTLADTTRNLLRDRYMVRYEPMIEKILRDGFPTFTGGLLARGDDLVYSTKRILDFWDKDEPVENNILKINLKLGLPAILTVDEQVGRYSGVEPVSPLMDHNIVEYVCSVRPKDRAPIPKFMFREALKDILPEKIRMRYDKMGFPVPYKKWNWEDIKPIIKSFADRKLIDVDLTKHNTMDRKTWALYTIEAWHRHYFEKPPEQEL